jgi:AAA ATPase domain
MCRRRRPDWRDSRHRPQPPTCSVGEGYVRAQVPQGGRPPGIALLVRSAYAHRRGTCFSPGLASLERLGQPAILVGRRGEYALIGAILDRAAADDAALLLCGEPGAGKTVLLDAAADTASAAGAWVLRPAGAEFKVRWDAVDLYRLATDMIAEESAAWLSAPGACELADKPPYAWIRQESPG